MKIVQLQLNTPLHIHGITESYDQSSRVIHSDMLYAAIMQAWAMLGKSEWIPKTADEQTAFAISSLFPFTRATKSNSTCFFFPRIFKPFKPTTFVKESAKKIKKIQWLDFDYFFQLLSSEAEVKAEHLQEQYLCKETIETNFMKTAVSQRYSSKGGADDDTETRPGTTYYVEQIWFKKGSGFFFLYDGDDTFFNDKLLPALRLLADEGLGTDRNLGYGKFEIKVEELPSEWQQKWQQLQTTDSPFRTNLSLFCPPQNGFEQLMNGAKYELLKREGYITTPGSNTLRKKPVYMFREGGVFRTNDSLLGKTVDLKPEKQNVPHPVWRVGRSIFLPVKISKQ